jgi:hypothetical protein
MNMRMFDIGTLVEERAGYDLDCRGCSDANMHTAHLRVKKSVLRLSVPRHSHMFPM